jgi:hypothetical protein
MSNIESNPENSGIEGEIGAQQEKLDTTAAELQTNLEQFDQLATKEPKNGWSAAVKKGIEGVKTFITEDAILWSFPALMGGLVAADAYMEGINTKEALVVTIGMTAVTSLAKVAAFVADRIDILG